jgi:hypothetical protein
MARRTCPFYPWLLNMSNTKFCHLIKLFLHNKFRSVVCTWVVIGAIPWSLLYLIKPFTHNKSLSQNIIRCLLKFTYYATQHLWIHQIHMQTINNNKKSPTYKHATLRSLSHSLCFYNHKMWSINIWQCIAIFQMHTLNIW